MQMVRRWTFLVLVATAFQFLAAEAGEQKFVAMLIWGTDGDKPDEKSDDKSLKEVDPALREKFGKIFKWKNYYEVCRETVTVKPGESKNVKLSKKCEVKLVQTEKEGLNVELIGDGKSVYKGNRSMPLKDIFILAGDDKNATAWFVVLKPE